MYAIIHKPILNTYFESINVCCQPSTADKLTGRDLVFCETLPDTLLQIYVIAQLCRAHGAPLSLTWLALVMGGGNILLFLPSLAKPFAFEGNRVINSLLC